MRRGDVIVTNGPWAEAKEVAGGYAMTGIAHTLPYDLAIVNPHQQGRPLPTGRHAGVDAPTLVLAGGKSPDTCETSRPPSWPPCQTGAWSRFPDRRT